MPSAFPTPALVVVDMIEDYFDAELWPNSELPGLRKQLAKAVNRAVQLMREQSFPVFWIRQGFRADLSDAFPHMRKTGRAYTLAGSPGAELLEELDVSEEDRHVFKTRYSAFFKTTLQAELQELQVDTLILAGITTSWCIRSTATDAYQHDYAVLLVGEALGGFLNDDHQRDLAAMNATLAEVVSLDSLPAQFQLSPNS